MEENKEHTPTILRELRQRLGLSQKQVVRRVRGIDQARLARYEAGTQIPPLAHALRLAFFYQEPVHRLFPVVFDTIRADILENGFAIRSIRRRAYFAEEGGA